MAGPRLLLASLALLSMSCQRLSMRDSQHPQQATATFHYAMPEGNRSPDYSAIDQQVLSGRPQRP